MGKKAGKVLSVCIIGAAVAIAVLPLAMTTRKSLEFKEGYKDLVMNPVYLRLIWNSVALLLPILAGQFLIAPLAAYGFCQWRWKYKEGLFFVYMIVMLMPMQLTLVPHYLVTGWLGIRHSWWAIILPAMFHPLGVFLIRQQIKDFPEECLEAARLDGAGEFQIYRRIMYPNMTGVISAMLILLFVDNWNIVDQAVVFIEESYKFPMSVYLSQLLDGEAVVYYAASVIYMLPALFAFLMAKEYLIEGISMSGVKS